MGITFNSDLAKSFAKKAGKKALKNALGFPSFPSAPKAKPEQNTDAVIHVFPSDLAIDRPLIKFSALERKSTSNGAPKPWIILLPAPTGIAFNDGAEYNTFNLGIIGTPAADKLKGLGMSGIMAAIDNPQAAFSAQNLTNQANRGLDFLRGQVSANAQEILSLLKTENPLTSESGRNNASIRTGTVANPNTSSGFASNRIRQFSFSFKMIAQNQKESEQIQQIQRIFRRYMYGKKGLGGLQLEYPSIWSIDFFNLQNESARNPFIPKIASCYLTDLNTTFNTSSDVYFENDAPLEVDITVNFAETRALSYNDIVALEEDEKVNTEDSLTFADTYATRIDDEQTGELFKESTLGLIDKAQSALNGQGQNTEVVPDESSESTYRGPAIPELPRLDQFLK